MAQNLLDMNITGPEALAEDAAPFLRRTLPAGPISLIAEKQNELTNRAIRGFEWLLGSFVGSLITLLLLRLALTVTESKNLIALYAFAPWVLWVGGAALLTALIFCVMGVVRVSKTSRQLQSPDWQEEADHAERDALRSLAVPEDAAAVEFFYSFYKVRHGVRRPCRLNDCTYMNLPKYVFREGGALCLAAADSVLAIPFDALGELRRVPGKISFPYWMKETPVRSPQFADCGLRKHRHCFSCAYCYELSIHTQEKEYVLILPPYELAAFAALTGISASAI